MEQVLCAHCDRCKKIVNIFRDRFGNPTRVVCEQCSEWEQISPSF